MDVNLLRLGDGSYSAYLFKTVIVDKMKGLLAVSHSESSAVFCRCTASASSQPGCRVYAGSSGSSVSSKLFNSRQLRRDSISLRVSREQFPISWLVYILGSDPARLQIRQNLSVVDVGLTTGFLMLIELRRGWL